MKFTDKKYLHLENTKKEKIYQINFDAYQIGGEDDISLILTINQDNSMDLEFDTQTITMFNDPNFFFPIKERNSMVKFLKNRLIEYPYPTDYLELIFV